MTLERNEFRVPWVYFLPVKNMGLFEMYEGYSQMAMNWRMIWQVGHGKSKRLSDRTELSVD